MIIIQYKCWTATFTGEEWHSEDEFLQETLNYEFSIAEIGSRVWYRSGPQGTVGIDAIALEAISFLKDVKVIKNEPPALPKEIDGVDY